MKILFMTSWGGPLQKIDKWEKRVEREREREKD
jgi:hypothetical protein